MTDRKDPVTPAEKEAFRRTARPANTAAGAVYPNREHRNADRASRRHAAIALHELQGMALRLAQKLDTGSSEFEATDADRLAEQVGKARAAFAELAILRDVREWHAADVAEAAETGTSIPGPGPTSERDSLAAQQEAALAAEPKSVQDVVRGRE
jgi:hypothetical protein